MNGRELGARDLLAADLSLLLLDQFLEFQGVSSGSDTILDFVRSQQKVFSDLILGPDGAEVDGRG